MATKLAKVLQKPEILSIVGSTIRIKHPDISRYTRTRIASPLSAAGTTLTVLDNNTFEDDDWFILGEVGDKKTEECDVNGTVTRGTSLTITNSTKFSHELDSPVTKIYERGIKIYGAASDGGTLTLIVSVDAITTPVADAVSIQWDKPYTEYTIQSTDTAYAYYAVKFADGTTDSSVSDYILAAGLVQNTVQKICEQALLRTNTTVGDSPDDLITWKFLIEACNSAQDTITQHTDEMGIRTNWPFEMIENDTSIATTENENKYALSGLTYALKYPDTKQAVINVRFGNELLDYLPIDEFDEEMENKIKGELETTVAAGSTSLTLVDSYEFAESGTIYLGEDEITYTANAQSTGILSGIPASGTGSITTTHTAGATAWQGITPSVPTKYTIYDGNILLDVPVETDEVGKKLKFRYFKALTALTETTDTTEITFYNIIWMYIAAMIEYAKGNTSIANDWLAKFENKLNENAKGQHIYTTQQTIYYKFGSNHPLDNND